MALTWLWVVVCVTIAGSSADRGGSSLRGALEALQRRQRGRMHGPILPQPDYDSLYEFVPPQSYPEADYDVIEDVNNEPNPKYVVKFLDDNDRPPEAYEYKLIKKKNSHFNSVAPNKQESAFRERVHSNNDKLRDLFMEKGEEEENPKGSRPNINDKDEEYALLLGQLWSKYKYGKEHVNNEENASRGVVKLYKEKVVKKRYPDNWGPIAFKRKRSSDSDADRPILSDYGERKHESGTLEPGYNPYDINEDNDKDDLREEYAIAFQPLDDDTLSDLADDDQYTYDTIEKRFPVTKRSSGPYDFGAEKKFQSQNKREAFKSFRSSSGTDPKVIRELSKIFGDPSSELIKSPVKRSSDHADDAHEAKPPMLPQDHNHTAIEDDNSHDQHGHNIHHPGIPGTEVIVEHDHNQEHQHDHDHDHDHEHDYEHGHNIHHPGIPGTEVIVEHDNNKEHQHDHDHEHDYEHGHNIHHPGIPGTEVIIEHDNNQEHQHDHDHELDHEHNHKHTQKDSEKPINVRKKSIDWSDYFGIDKRKSVAFANDATQDRLRKQYFDIFNKEVIYPLNSFRRHNYSKRNLIKPKPNEVNQLPTDRTETITVRSEKKRSSTEDNNSKLDNIDKKLKSMEGLIVDEALHYSNIGEELDSKEEQEMKEKLLSRLAAAYSLEKMRKALKEFKHSIQTQKEETSDSSSVGESKDKRVAVKKELLNNEIPLSNQIDDKIYDFEDEQGAGHYLNGKVEEQFSEGYMGGSGRHRIPVVSTASATGACPVLTKIVQRCQNVDLLAGDRGQLFLPLCSLHQICYLCGEAPPTTCDLVFLSEADTTCEGDMSCQRAARSALMALRELHDTLADELDGECEASPCLPATLKLNLGWQRALQR